MRRNSVRVGMCFTAALIALGCGDRRSSEMPSAEYPKTGVAGGDVAMPGATVTDVAAIVASPAQFIGKTVTVEADVDEVLGPQAFELDEDSPMRGGVDNDLIVAYPMSLRLAPLDNKWLKNKVRVTGTVRAGSVVELERELGWDMSEELEADIKIKPVLVAHSVERLNRP